MPRCRYGQELHCWRKKHPAPGLIKKRRGGGPGDTVPAKGKGKREGAPSLLLMYELPRSRPALQDPSDFDKREGERKGGTQVHGRLAVICTTQTSVTERRGTKGIPFGFGGGKKKGGIP